MKNTIFTGSAVAIVTPMHPDGSVNYEEFGRLIDFQIENGTDAIVVCGTTGESATLSHKEHCEVIQYGIKRTAGRVPLIAGTGSNDTAFALELSQEAERDGADALLMVTPYYNKASQAGLIRHYTHIADRVTLPIILYNVPSRTGCNIAPQTYAALGQHQNIAAIKEANGDISAIAKTFAACGDLLDIYSGNDDQTTAICALGGKGIISVAANICPRVMHEIAAKALAGDFKGSAKLQLEYLSLMNALFMDVNPIPVKEAVNLLGFKAGDCRMPLSPLSDGQLEILRGEMKKFGLIS